MGLLFYQDGRPNLKLLTLQTSILALLYINADRCSLKRIKDNSMSPFFQTAASDSKEHALIRKIKNILFSDLVLYQHFPRNQKSHALKGKIIAI